MKRNWLFFLTFARGLQLPALAWMIGATINGPIASKDWRGIQLYAAVYLTLTIVNGVLDVQLVPTTTASAGAQYNVTFNNAGVNQFTEVWAVPPSTVPLRLSAVLVSQGEVRRRVPQPDHFLPPDLRPTSRAAAHSCPIVAIDVWDRPAIDAASAMSEGST